MNSDDHARLAHFMAAFPNAIEHDPAVSKKKQEAATRIFDILRESGISFDADMCGRLCKLDGSSGAKDILRLPTRLVAFHDDDSYNVTEHPITMTENDEEAALNTIVETLSKMRSGGKKRKMSVNETRS